MSGALPSDHTNPAAHFAAKRAHTGRVEFQWNGPIHDQTTRFIMEWMEERLDQLQSSSLQKKRVVRVAVELLQNMHHHASQNARGSAFEILSLGDTKWQMSSKNAIAPSQTAALEENWKALKAMCKDELRTMQREKIAREDRSSHGGGGVGLNEILRKAAGHVHMDIEHKKEEAYVTFTAEISIR